MTDKVSMRGPRMTVGGDLYQPDEQNDHVSGNLGTKSGYAVTLPVIREATWKTVNGWLYAPDGVYMPLFLVEYVTSFTLAGNTAQSQMVRSFFPHNFTQPEFHLAGQSPNQYYYNRLGEFVRYFQRKALTMASPGKLLVPDGNRYAPKSRNPRNSQRGANRGFFAEGYIGSMERGGQQFQFAPDFSFDFTVSNMLEGLYHEDPVTIHKLRSWAEIFKDDKHVWEADPDAVDIATSVLSNLADEVGVLGGHSFP